MRRKLGAWRVKLGMRIGGGNLGLGGRWSRGLGKGSLVRVGVCVVCVLRQVRVWGVVGDLVHVARIPILDQNNVLPYRQVWHAVLAFLWVGVVCRSRWAVCVRARASLRADLCQRSSMPPPCMRVSSRSVDTYNWISHPLHPYRSQDTFVL